jgi:hypothetical protein
METPLMDHGTMGGLRELLFLVETSAKARAKFFQLLDQRGILPFAEIEAAIADPATHHVTARVKLSDEFVGILATLRTVQGDRYALAEGETSGAHEADYLPLAPVILA